MTFTPRPKRNFSSSTSSSSRSFSPRPHRSGGSSHGSSRPANSPHSSAHSSTSSRPHSSSSSYSSHGPRKPFSHSSSGSRPSFGGGSRFKKPFGGNGGSRGGGGGRRGPKPDFINENLFINKAKDVKEEIYTAKHTFADFNIHENLANNLDKKGFVNPSPIQDQAIPLLLEGKDLIGIASTGTGKTAAFLIPIINKFVEDRKHQAMILTPTRELAQQVEEEFKSFTLGMRLFSVAVVGGLPITRQIRELNDGVHIVIGTPGRVKDLIARGKIHMKDFNTIVLDEADRMLDMGFIDDMKEILGAMPKEKQGMFFSATFSTSIKALCSDFLRSPVTVSLKTRDTSASVDQDVVRVGKGNKIEILHEILNKEEVKKVLIFCETKRHTDALAKELKDRGFGALALHGDMRSRERMRAVEALASGKAKIVVATDVAARGIDIPDITHVINYETPSTYDTYVHRIGRTGRASKKGIALTFVR